MINSISSLKFADSTSLSQVERNEWNASCQTKANWVTKNGMLIVNLDK